MKTITEMIAVMQHFADGGVVEIKQYQSKWKIDIKPDWDWESEDFRIKVEPKFEVGDWLLDNKYHTPFQITEGMLVDNLLSDSLKRWTPTKNEECVFWSQGNYYEIKKFLKDESLLFHTTDGSSYDHVAPLEFAMTLR